MLVFLGWRHENAALSPGDGRFTISVRILQNSGRIFAMQSITSAAPDPHTHARPCVTRNGTRSKAVAFALCSNQAANVATQKSHRRPNTRKVQEDVDQLDRVVIVGSRRPSQGVLRAATRFVAASYWK
jgi:hypothetical protein